MIVWYDLQPIEKIRVYNRGVEVINFEANIYNTRIQCLSGKAPSIVTGKSGWKVVKILEAAQISIKI